MARRHEQRPERLKPRVVFRRPQRRNPKGLRIVQALHEPLNRDRHQLQELLNPRRSDFLRRERQRVRDAGRTARERFASGGNERRVLRRRNAFVFLQPLRAHRNFVLRSPHLERRNPTLADYQRPSRLGNAGRHRRDERGIRFRYLMDGRSQLDDIRMNGDARRRKHRRAVAGAYREFRAEIRR